MASQWAIQQMLAQTVDRSSQGGWVHPVSVVVCRVGFGVGVDCCSLAHVSCYLLALPTSFKLHHPIRFPYLNRIRSRVVTKGRPLV